MFDSVPELPIRPPPRISVCVPIYNGADYLDECLSGIAAQTFGDFEVVIVDDVSTDDSVSIARRWAERDARFIVHVNAVNRGLVGNWNRCLELARGEWVKFLFQDDLMTADCICRMLEVGEESRGFVACSRNFLFEPGTDETTRTFYDVHRTSINAILTENEGLTAEQYCVAKFDHMHLNIVGEPSVTLIRRDLFERVGLFDPLLIQICDSEMWTRIASLTGVRFIAADLVAFRVHGNSASSVNRGRYFRGTLIEGILEASKMCLSPEFDDFRQALKRTGRLESLRASLSTQINIAFYSLRDLKGDPDAYQKSRNDLKEALDPFIGFAHARNQHLLFRLRRLFNLVEPVPSD